jgi:hypothetical protein
MAMAEFSELGDTNLRAEGLVDFSVREVPDLVKSGEMLVFRVPLSCPSKGCPIQTQCPFPLLNDSVATVATVHADLSVLSIHAALSIAIINHAVMYL